MSDNLKYRIERDSIGELDVPIDAYYGIQTLRSKNNFEITKTRIHPEMIKSLAIVKKSCAQANMKAGYLDKGISDAIVLACDEIIEGKLRNHFITDAIQGGAGTSINMNANEVIANRAIEILGGEKGNYHIVHPNDHVNFGQSTNDVIPTSAKIAAYRLSERLQFELNKLNKAYLDKAVRYREAIKMGRTHLQDAVPISIGQEFGAFASASERDLNRIIEATKGLLITNMGATAVGTGLNADVSYTNYVYEYLKNYTNIDLKPAKNLIDQTRNLDNFLNLSSSLKVSATNLSKTANDLRLMSSGPTTGFGEINLPQVQPGSSIMPGKVNPVIPEVVNQVCFQVMGNDLTITKAAEAGQLELNVFEPVLIFNLFQSLDLLSRAIKAFTEKCIIGITVNEEKCIKYVEHSAGTVTALAPTLGYEICSEVAKEAVKTGKSVKSIIIKKGLLDEDQFKKIFNYVKMTKPGVLGKKKKQKEENNE